MERIYSVKQINTYIKMMFSQDFMLNKISIKGEVSNCKYHTSGHIYFTLKEESAVISCVMFAGNRNGLLFPLKNGQQIVVTGNVDVYERDGKYQLYAKKIVLDGIGALYERFESLKEALNEMGMFAPEYKKPIPFFVRKLGIVTAPTGAAVRDMIQIAKRRNPYIQIYLYPAKVQGENAAEEIAEGIAVLDRYGLDVMIIGRGGGSIEDLWAFNEEIVAEAIFRCKTPVISAVGHEIDTTISDYVADLRAPTPSAAAELAVREWESVERALAEYRAQLTKRMREKIEFCKMRLRQQTIQISAYNPARSIQEEKKWISEREEKLQMAMKNVLSKKRHQLSIYIEKMKGFSPLDKLRQGYAFVENEQGNPVTQIGQVKTGEKMKIYILDGCIEVKVIKKEKKNRFPWN